jgi:hypothetical protein
MAQCDSSACGMSDSAGAPAQQTYVSAERAVIIWDGVHHVEHFIRQAIIHTQDSDLGFLVPSPNTPTLSNVDSPIFEDTAAEGSPRVKEAPVDSRGPWSVIEPVIVNPVLQLGRLSPTVLLSFLTASKSVDGRSSVLSE